MFFGDTMSRGKKNDHIFHSSCLTYLVKFYDNERVNAGKNKIPINIVHTDNCAPQYKCRQNFLQVAMTCETKDGVVVHKFAQKYRFKGSWDATRKLVKQAINQLEMSNIRVPNANACYFKLREELTKDSTEAKTMKLLENERTHDKRV